MFLVKIIFNSVLSGNQNNLLEKMKDGGFTFGYVDRSYFRYQETSLTLKQLGG